MNKLLIVAILIILGGFFILLMGYFFDRAWSNPINTQVNEIVAYISGFIAMCILIIALLIHLNIITFTNIKDFIIVIKGIANHYTLIFFYISGS